jgi:hypothetical protein
LLAGWFSRGSARQVDNSASLTDPLVQKFSDFISHHFSRVASIETAAEKLIVFSPAICLQNGIGSSLNPFPQFPWLLVRHIVC